MGNTISNRIMRAWVYDRYGKAEVLEQREVPIPRPERGRILVRVRAAALNPKDGFVRRGLYRILSGSRFPKFIGLDWAGEVAEIGGGVREYKISDRVYGHLNEWKGTRGSLAQFVMAKSGECAPLPEKLSFEEAAALPITP